VGRLPASSLKRRRGTIALVRYLGLDVGDRWIGLATGDAAGRIASPLRTMRRSTRATAVDIDEIAAFCVRDSIDSIVLGLPRNMDGTLGEQARRTLIFGQKLRGAGLSVLLHDERLSSAAALDYVLASRGRPPRRGEHIDHVAAAIILQDYFDGIGREESLDEIVAALGGA